MTNNSEVVNRELKPFFAELIGTLFLAATVGVVSIGSIIYPEYQALYLPLAVGLVVGLFVYLVGPISGGHFNPSVSLGLFLVRKINAKQLLICLLGQVAGAFLGFRLVHTLIGNVPQVPSAVSSGAMLGEFLGAFLLVFAVTCVTLGKVSQAASGLVIGAALFLGTTLSLVISGGLLNPALALALGAYHFSYLLAPLLGGGVAASLAVWLHHS